jgi:hypothetical protein
MFIEGLDPPLTRRGKRAKDAHLPLLLRVRPLSLRLAYQGRL